MFTIIIEKDYSSIMSFDAWSGGKETLDYVRKYGLEDELEALFEESFDLTEPISEDDLNNWLWFDVDLEELEAQAKEEEEEE